MEIVFRFESEDRANAFANRARDILHETIAAADRVVEVSDIDVGVTDIGVPDKGIWMDTARQFGGAVLVVDGAYQ